MILHYLGSDGGDEERRKRVLFMVLAWIWFCFLFCLFLSVFFRGPSDPHYYCCGLIELENWFVKEGRKHPPTMCLVCILLIKITVPKLF